MKEQQFLTVPAIEVSQSPGRKLYSFALDGKLIPTVATVSRLRRSSGELEGYQRPEILSHISEIRSYLESESPMIPNAIVVAFDSRVEFEPTNGSAIAGESRNGLFRIPIDPELPDWRKPGFIVDGQQRLAAIRDARVGSFPILVTAFVTDDMHEQTEQFMLVNSTKPLPKSLIYELLPSTTTTLPSLLERRKFPAYLLQRLNSEETSPLFRRIKTTTNPEGLVKDNSILKMLENSINDGALYRYRDLDDQMRGADDMIDVVSAFWQAAATVFDDAWDLPPRKSRLMHGAGIVSMGFMMDAIADRREAKPNKSEFEADLRPIKDVCRWTHGYWDFGPGYQRKWNEVQNTSRDIQLLSNYLLVQYKNRVWNQT